MKYLENLEVFLIKESLFMLYNPESRKSYFYQRETGAIAFLLEDNLHECIATANRISSTIDVSKQAYYFNPTEFLLKKKETRLMLFLTSACNLRCIYCHCNSGEGSAMSEYYINNAIQKYINFKKNDLHSPEKLQITFMGGGEPMLYFNKIKDIVNSLNLIKDDINVTPEYVLVTNGTVGTDKDWDWLINQNFRITISFDGPPDIQDRQRPFQNSKLKTSRVVEERLRWLGNYNAKVHIRTTVLDAERVPDICNYVEQFNCVETHALEPVSIAGRAESLEFSNSFSPDNFHSLFFKNYSSYLYSNPSRYKSSWFKPFKRMDGFCGAVYCNSIVTHDGYVTLCTEVDSSALSKPYGEKFIVSHVDDDGNPFRSPKALEFSTNHSFNKLPYCQECVIKYKCGGGCYIKRERDFSNNYKSFYEAFCTNAIKLNLSYIIHLFEEHKKTKC